MKQFYEKYFAGQLGKPTGLFGRFYMQKFLSVGNQRSNELALKHLDISGSSRVLEIGFGGGWLLQQLVDATPEGKVVGLDHSKTMVASARRAFRNHPFKPELVFGSADQLPFESKCFTHVVAVHALYFWKDPKRILREIYQVLKPGGTLVIGIHAKAKLETQPLTRHGFTLYTPEDVIELLTSCSFQNVKLYSYDPDEWEDNHIIVAHRPKAENEKNFR